MGDVALGMKWTEREQTIHLRLILRLGIRGAIVCSHLPRVYISTRRNLLTFIRILFHRAINRIPYTYKADNFILYFKFLVERTEDKLFCNVWYCIVRSISPIYLLFHFQNKEKFCSKIHCCSPLEPLFHVSAVTTKIKDFTLVIWISLQFLRMAGQYPNTSSSLTRAISLVFILPHPTSDGRSAQSFYQHGRHINTFHSVRMNFIFLWRYLLFPEPRTDSTSEA